MYPALITAAFFSGVLINDLLQKKAPMDIGKHLFFGFIAVIGLWALEARDMPIVAWGLLAIPIIVFASSLLYVFINPPEKPKPVVLPPVLPPPPPKPKEQPAEIQVPDENTVCVELEFDPNKRKPQPLPTCDVGPDGTIGMPGTVGKVPSCPAVSSGSSFKSSAETSPTLDTLVKSVNTSLTPVTVCST